MEKVIEALLNGGIILYPTDTVWALGCDATNEEACQKLIEILGSKPKEGITLLADNFPMIERYIPEFVEVCYDLVDFAVNPLTIVYPNAKGIANCVLEKDGSVGIRITEDAICRKLIRSIRKPLVAATIESDGKILRRFDELPQEIISSVDAVVSERQNEKMKSPAQIIKIGLSGDVAVIRK